MTDRARPGLVAFYDIRPGNKEHVYSDNPGTRMGLQNGDILGLQNEDILGLQNGDILGLQNGDILIPANPGPPGK